MLIAITVANPVVPLTCSEPSRAPRCLCLVFKTIHSMDSICLISHRNSRIHFRGSSMGLSIPPYVP